jgi:hypothetical protein
MTEKVERGDELKLGKQNKGNVKESATEDLRRLNVRKELVMSLKL